MLLAPVAAMQKVATVTSPAESLGKAPVAPVTVTGGTGRPVRLIPGEPGRVWKHGTVVSLLQQLWLSPPLTSTHTMWLGFDGSSIMLTQEIPVQLSVPQPADEQPSSAIGTPWAKFSVQGLDPPVPGVWSVPEVIGSAMVKVAVLSEPTPVGPFAVQGVVPAASQPLRQNLSCDFAGTGKLCDTPVQPLSRSVPWSSVVKIASSGPPAAFGGQAASGTAVAVQPMSGGGGQDTVLFLLFLQTRMNLSMSGPPDA